MNINIIAALTENSRVIGKDGKMPWHIPADLKRFQMITMGHPVIMGRKTFESIGGSLPGRTNIVLSHTTRSISSDIIVANSLAQAIFLATRSEGGSEIFIIGGEGVFRDTLKVAGRLYLTKIKTDIAGDTFFPPFEHLFRRSISSEVINDGGHTVIFETLER